VNTRSIILGLFSGVLMLSGLAAKAGTAEEAVIAGENQITKSQQTNNVELQAPLLADKYVATDEDGTVLVRGYGHCHRHLRRQGNIQG